MKMNGRVTVCLLVAIFGCAGQLCAGDASATNTLNGYFTWSGDKTGSRGVSANKDGKMEIKMVLTPTAGTNECKAVFVFLWDKHEQNWKGTYKCDPQTGVVTGATGNWIIKGKATDGTISCKYFEVKDGKEVAGGEIVFKS